MLSALVDVTPYRTNLLSTIQIISDLVDIITPYTAEHRITSVFVYFYSL